MAIITTWNYSNDGLFANAVAASGERLWFSGDASNIDPVEVDAFQDGSIVGNSDGTLVTAEANNCKYESPTQVSLNGGGAVTLDVGNVAQTDCTLRLDWEDDSGATTLDTVKLFAHKPTLPATAPDDSVWVGFERTSGAIRKSRDEGLSDGDAWDTSAGIGGSANALDCADKASANNHQFFFGISGKTTAFGENTDVVLRCSFNAS